MENTTWSAERVVILLLAVVISAYLLVALLGVTACIWHVNKCTDVDFRFYLGEPLSALLGLLGGKAIARTSG